MDEKTQELDRFPAPFNKDISLSEIIYENGFPMLKIQIREGRRFTTLELDPATAEHWGQAMSDWAQAQDLSKLE